MVARFTQSGHRNMLGLTPAGVQLIKELMKRGMIVDIDRMSQKSADQTLAIAETYGYPIMSGHSGIRGWQGASAENSRTPVQLQRISRLHGMFGLGTDGAYSSSWAQTYQQAILKMGYMNPAIANYQNGAVGLGTDLNGLVKGPKPGGPANRVVYDASFPPSGTAGSAKTWNYNSEGVAHYGMLPDFIRDVRTAPSNGYTGPNGVHRLFLAHLAAGRIHEGQREMMTRGSARPCGAIARAP
jgi:microsomal dipeptidase-like Zn-dependent dipeptidase